MPAHFKSSENVTVANIGLAFTRCRHKLKTIENSTITNLVQSLQESDAKEMYPHLDNRSAPFLKALKNVPFLSFSNVHMMLFQHVPVGVPFQSLPFSKSSSKECTVFV